MPSLTGFVKLGESYVQREEETGAIKQPRRSFLPARGDISNPRLCFVSLQLLRYHGAQFDTLQKKRL